MEEMSTREIIETIVKGKSTIVAFTVICIAVTLVVNVFIMEPVYEAETMLMISPISQSATSVENTNEFSSIVSAIASYPKMSIDTYREQIKAPAVLQHIKEEMNLKDLSLNSISNKITVEGIKNTNLVKVKIRDKDAETAAKIANILSERFTKYVSDTNQKQAESSTEIIETQMHKEKENMESITEKIKNFVSKPRSPEELKMELESKLMQITNFKTSLAQIKVDEENTRRSIEKAKSLLSQTPKTLVTNSTLYGEDLLLDIIKDKNGINTNTLNNVKLSNEEVNQIYVELSNSLNQLEIQLANLEASRKNTEQAILECQKEIETIQVEYAEKQKEYDELNLELDLSKQAYQAYQKEYKELMIKQSTEIGKSSIVVVSEAMVPKSPVAPNKTVNIAVAGMCGLLMGILVVFIKQNMSTINVVSHRKAA